MSFVCSTEPLFFVGQPLDVLQTLRTLLPDAPSSQAQRLFSMVVLLVYTADTDLIVWLRAFVASTYMF